MIKAEGKKRGRNRTKYNEQELYAIIDAFRKERQQNGEIAYMDLYRFHLELHKKSPDIYPRTFKESFWRRDGQPGRQAIDTENKNSMSYIVEGDENKRDIPNVVEVVDRYHNNPEILKKHLLVLENTIRKSIKKEMELTKIKEGLENQLKVLKEQKKEIDEKNTQLQNLLYKFFRYSDIKDGLLENKLNLNNKNRVIKRALEEVFVTPTEFYDSLDSYIEAYNDDSSKNAVPIRKLNKRKEPTLGDDFEGMF
ncbi:hypothetical protein ABE033_10355 [Priestia megaterium]